MKALTAITAKRLLILKLGFSVKLFVTPTQITYKQTSTIAPIKVIDSHGGSIPDVDSLNPLFRVVYSGIVFVLRNNDKTKGTKFSKKLAIPFIIEITAAKMNMDWYLPLSSIEAPHVFLILIA